MAEQDRMPFFETIKPFLKEDLPSLLVVRHGERDPVPEGSDLMASFLVHLTDKGREDSKLLGTTLSKEFPELKLGLAMSSPIQRTVDTVVGIVQGGGFHPEGKGDEESIQESLVVDSILVGKDLYTREAGQAILNDHSLMKKALKGEFPIGEKSIEEAGEALMKFLTQKMGEHLKDGGPLLGVAGSHDMIMVLLLAKYFGLKETGEKFPKLLECFLVQRLPSGKHRLIWRGDAKEF